MGAIHLEKALAIKGWMAPDELAWLAEIASNSVNIIEVGCFKGRSTRALCDNTPGMVLAIDPWNGPYITDRGTILFDQQMSWPEFQRNLDDVTNLSIFRGTFEEFGKTNRNKIFDFIFIDGDHRYSTVIQDIELGLELLMDGGILAGHDYKHQDWPGVKKAVDEKFPDARFINSIWWIQKF